MILPSIVCDCYRDQVTVEPTQDSIFFVLNSACHRYLLLKHPDINKNGNIVGMM